MCRAHGRFDHCSDEIQADLQRFVSVFVFVKYLCHGCITGEVTFVGSFNALPDLFVLPCMQFQKLVDHLIDQVISGPALLFRNLVQFLDLFAVRMDAKRQRCFRIFFGLTVLLNCAGLAWLHTSEGQTLLEQLQ